MTREERKVRREGYFLPVTYLGDAEIALRETAESDTRKNILQSVRQQRRDRRRDRISENLRAADVKQHRRTEQCNRRKPCRCRRKDKRRPQYRQGGVMLRYDEACGRRKRCNRQNRCADQPRLHRRIADMQYKPYQRFLQQAISDLMSSCPQREVEINGVTIAAMPSLLTMLHQLLHIEYHVLREGIGLRQFCDLAVFLQRYSGEIKGRHSRKEIQRLIDGCGISDVAAAVGHILHSELNLSTEHIPFRTSENGAELIMEDIWQGGNFGKLLTARYEGYGFIRRKIVMTPLHWKRYRRYRHLLPNEAFANFISKFGRAAKGVK